MEETNYKRSDTQQLTAVGTATSHSGEKSQPHIASAPGTESQRPQSQLTFWGKLALFKPKHLQNDSKILDSIRRPFIFFTFPGVVFAGFSYGAAVCWHNVLNGTVSPFLSSPPYNFDAGMVGLSYVSCLIGVVFA